jgi:peroxiredoxin
MVATNDMGGLISERFFKNLFPIPPTNQFPLGMFAPPFELLNVQTGQFIKLSDYVGTPTAHSSSVSVPIDRRPVVLAFTRIFTDRHYCPLCHPHIVSVNQAYEKFVQRGAEVLMITSTDKPQSENVIRDLGLQMPLLSDPGCQVFRMYRLGQALGAPLPAQFVLDRTGQIRFRHLFSFLEPNASVDRLLATLDTF